MRKLAPSMCAKKVKSNSHLLNDQETQAPLLTSQTVERRRRWNWFGGTSAGRGR